MLIAKINGTNIHYTDCGYAEAPAIIFANSLGSDFRLWDGIIEHFTKDFRIIRYDKRGHGLSDISIQNVTIELLGNDLDALLEYLGVKEAIICGISVGGMIAQSVATTNPSRVKALVLCNTGPKIGTIKFWNERIDAINKNGISSVSEAIFERWFSGKFKRTKTLELNGWGNMLIRTPKAGYIATCEAIKKADLTKNTAKIFQPTLCIAGDEDLSTPTELVESMLQLIEGSTFKVIEGAGHLPCIEKPDILAKHMHDFFKENNIV